MVILSHDLSEVIQRQKGSSREILRVILSIDIEGRRRVGILVNQERYCITRLEI